MTEVLVTLQQEQSVARVTLNRPSKRNALTDQLIGEINAHVKTVAEDESVRVLVLAAEGSVFCAGMDLAQMEERARADNAEELWLQDSRLLRDTFRSLFELPIPTIAVVQGPAVAGGLGLVLACDLVIAAEEAFFALPEPQRGITAAMVTPLLLHRVGVNAASELLLSGDRISSTRARETGLCQQVVATAELDAAVERTVTGILRGSRAALAQTKRHLADCAGPIMEQLEQSVELSADARRTADAREGLAAFLEKRKPNWM